MFSSANSILFFPWLADERFFTSYVLPVSMLFSFSYLT